MSPRNILFRSRRICLGTVLLVMFGVSGCGQDPRPISDTEVSDTTSSNEQGSQASQTAGDQALQGREKGVREATLAIAEGQLKLKEYPPTPSPPGHNEYVALLREKCGVTYKAISHPGFSEELKQEVGGWNEVMEAEIKRKFGEDIFQQLHDEAKKRRESQLSSRSGKQPNVTVPPESLE